jgi:putative cardiolipin synthase
VSPLVRNLLASVVGCLLLAACSTLPPGSRYPRATSVTTLSPTATRLGKQFAAAADAHQGRSGFRVIPVGVDGLLTRLELVNAAERTLDLQYYIFHADESGRLMTQALIKAADRGVRIRVLVDDGETLPGDEQLFSLDAHANIEVRVFNPWAYRGHGKVWRDAEFVFNRARLDYRMHNKLFVADNAMALLGGRNIGDQYFQIDPGSQFADDDLFSVGPVVGQLSGEFDEFWNSTLAIPVAALTRHLPPPPPPSRGEKAKKAGFDYADKLSAGEPFADLISGRTPLLWAHPILACDSPDKKKVLDGDRAGSLMYKPVAEAIRSVQQELLLVTPYFVPSAGELQLLKDLKRRGARVAVLTNSLESAPDTAAHSGYMHYRTELLAAGVELFEVRAQIDSTRGSGQSRRISKFGNYALHGKLLVFDRRRVYVGSMNFDHRSAHLNTEIGVILDNEELSQQVAARFAEMTRPESAYSLALTPKSPSTRNPSIIWRTRQDGADVELRKEPARSAWQRFKVNLLKLLPLDPEL